MKSSNVYIEGVENYEFSNGKRPSGNGGWYFARKSRIDFDKDVNGVDYIIIQDMYGKAKSVAKKWGAEHGYSVVYLQS